MPAVTLTGVVRPYHTDIHLRYGDMDRVQWRRGRQKGRPEDVRLTARLTICRNCGCLVYDRYSGCSVPRNADTSPQTCEGCAWRLKRSTRKLPQPTNKGNRTWHELAYLYAVAQLYLSEYKKAKRQRRI